MTVGKQSAHRGPQVFVALRSRRARSMACSSCPCGVHR
jgi:hypothetical protein